jgi:hypothetical protein
MDAVDVDAKLKDEDKDAKLKDAVQMHGGKRWEKPLQRRHK